MSSKSDSPNLPGSGGTIHIHAGDYPGPPKDDAYWIARGFQRNGDGTYSMRTLLWPDKFVDGIYGTTEGWQDNDE